MLLNSFLFLCIIPLVLCVYWIFVHAVGSRRGMFSSALLVGLSYAFYLYNAPIYTFLLIGVTTITYIFGRIFENKDRRGRLAVAMAVTLLVLTPLVLFKYSNMFLGLWGDFLSLFSVDYVPVEVSWILPLGISFFTFQALGYLWDVYHGKIEAEHNFLYYVLFVAFFPQIASGPISKASELMPQIKNPRKPTWNDATTGFKILLWGYFLKAVFADRFAIYSDAVFANYEMYSGWTCFLGSVAYSMRIYGDFAGYSLMALGVARMFGFDIINNFRRPYFAASLTDFWRRWHISLTRWFREHIYFPMGGNRKGKVRTYVNIVTVFVVSGAWHGANLTFIFWGLIHGIVQSVERFFGLTDTPTHRGIRFGRVILTFLIVNFAFIIFACPSIGDAWHFIERIFVMAPGESAGMKSSDVFLIMLALVVVAVKELCEEYCPSVTLINNRRLTVRVATVVALIFMILTSGVLDSSNFIYVNF